MFCLGCYSDDGDRLTRIVSTTPTTTVLCCAPLLLCGSCLCDYLDNYVNRRIVTKLDDNKVRKVYSDKQGYQVVNTCANQSDINLDRCLAKWKV